MGSQGDLSPAAAAAKGPPSMLYGGQQGGQQVGVLPISDDRQSFSSPVGPGGDQTEWAMSVNQLDDPASSARTAQDQWGGNGEPADPGSTFHGDPAQGPALGGQTPSAGQGSETRSTAPLSDPVRATPQSAAMWDTSAPRAMRLELQSPDGPPLRLHVSLVEQTVYAKVVTDQPDVQDFLLRNQSRLESQLHSHGLEMGQFSVSVDRQGQEPLSYGWEKIWQQSDRRSQGIPSPMEADAAVSASLEAGEQRRVNLFA
ncbi:MAG TPA: flagellar hook-length control protein FliK [Nitrospiraceae bacterium]|nr:flagellar hook-length control protein FliK [Nitrospiraceae bacterium]